MVRVRYTYGMLPRTLEAEVTEVQPLSLVTSVTPNSNPASLTLFYCPRAPGGFMGTNKRRHWVPVKCILLLVRKKGGLGVSQRELTRPQSNKKIEVLAPFEKMIVHLMGKSQQMTNNPPGKMCNK